MGAIGGVVGAIIVGLIIFIAKERSRSGAKQIFEALHAGGVAAARPLVDQRYPNRKNRAAPARFAALALIGDCETIERELPSLVGHPLWVATTQSVAWLALALYGRDAKTALARLADTTQRGISKAPRLAKVAIEHLVALSALGAATAGGPVSTIPAAAVWRLAGQDAMMRLLLVEAWARGYEAAGEPEKAANARERIRDLASLRDGAVIPRAA
jgi:hypothetical protein